MIFPDGALGVLCKIDGVDELKAQLVKIDRQVEELQREIGILDDR